MSLASQFQASGPLPSATFAGWDAQTTEQPLWATSGPGPGPGPAGTVYRASSVTPGGTIGIPNTPFTFPAVTEAGTFLLQGGQPTIANAPAAQSPLAFVFNINGTSALNYNFLAVPGSGSFSILLTLAIGDIVTVTVGQGGVPGATTWGAGGIAGLGRITVTP
jgi:hypothetical protein